ncbi:hypothetical protein WICPIJ_006998 [Wickerhamomyces pijperi]|uniref:Secreted protein n=1 Tax=Wickerhamomyces pijperi TaxID=599730 RepID=A0A9P8Q0P8_WICPI|nr:hypothetical protein WICPIJ_006998 [Wickerhamomyces pijperi]
MTRTFKFLHLSECFFDLLIFFTSASTSSVASPTPVYECNVNPLILQAANPVEAQTPIAPGDPAYFCLSLVIKALKRMDLPVPAEPV